jgi:hypothetical protein
MRPEEKSQFLRLLDYATDHLTDEITRHIDDYVLHHPKDNDDINILNVIVNDNVKFHFRFNWLSGREDEKPLKEISFSIETPTNYFRGWIYDYSDNLCSCFLKHRNLNIDIHSSIKKSKLKCMQSVYLIKNPLLEFKRPITKKQIFPNNCILNTDDRLSIEI